MNKIKEWFKLNRLKRIIISLIIILGSILTICLTSWLYTPKNINLSEDFAKSAEYVVKINSHKKLESNSERYNRASEVANLTRQRIDPQAIYGVNTSPEVNGDDMFVRVTYPNVNDLNQKNKIGDLVVDKPHLMFTDYYGNPLFSRNGGFNQDLGNADPGKALIKPEDFLWRQDSYINVADNGAKPYYDSKQKLEIKLDSNDVKIAWTQASIYIQKLPEDKRIIIAWLNIEEYINYAKTNWPKQWENADGNPYLFAFVDEKDVDSEKKPNVFKKHQMDVQKFLLSVIKVEKALFGNIYLESDSFTPNKVVDVANQINYGAANYNLEMVINNFKAPKNNDKSLEFTLIAIGVILAIISIFLIINYGLLGLIASLSLAIFTFLTITFLTIFGGVFSTFMIIGVILGIILFVDGCITTFEQFKREIYFGANVEKAIKNSNKKTIVEILDAKIPILVSTIVLFYFGSYYLRVFSLVSIIGSFFLLIVLFWITRLWARILLNNDIFKKQPKWLGLKAKFDHKIKEKIDDINLSKDGKRFGYTTLLFSSIGILVFAIFSAIGGSLSYGFNLDQAFSGGQVIQISNAIGSLTQNQLDQILEILNDNGVNRGEIEIFYNQSNPGLIDLVTVWTKRNLDFKAIKDQFDPNLYNFYSSHTNYSNAFQLMISILIALSVIIAFLSVYLLIRFKWTYMLSIVISLIFDLFITVIWFAIVRASINNHFVMGMLVIFFLSLNDKMTTLCKIREKMQIHIDKLDQKNTRSIGYQVIKELLKKKIMILSIGFMIAIVLLVFGNVTSMSFSFALILGTLTTFTSTSFLLVILWSRFETNRQKGIERRSKIGYWNVNSLEEQTFVGINNFNP